MSLLIARKQSGSHWYYPNGDACHEVPYADPSKGMRKTNLTDARKLGLYPSVTNILSMKAKPRLVDWQVEQGILAALTLPRKEGELDQDFAARVLEDSKQEMYKAADRGTLIHDTIEHYCLHGHFDCQPDLLPFVEPFEKFFRAEIAEVVATEAPLVSDSLGYAGRTDLVYISKTTGKLTIADYKTKKTANARRIKKTGELNPDFYIEWAMQLAAYGAAYNEMHQLTEVPDIVSIIVPSDEAQGTVYTKTWDNFDAALSAFKGCRSLWGFEKNYTPGSAS